jgi:Transcription factor zinc-finger
MSDEKDRYGDKLRDLEKAREEQWAREEDQRLLAKLRDKSHPDLLCPQCQSKLVASTGGPFATMGCPSGHGAWVDHQTLEALLKRVR